MNCMPRPVKHQILTPKAEKRKACSVSKLFQSLRFKKRLSKRKHTEIIFPHRDPCYRQRFVRRSPFADSLVDHSVEGYVRTSVPFFADSCVQLPTQVPSQGCLAPVSQWPECLDTTSRIQHCRGFQIQSSPRLPKFSQPNYHTHTNSAQSFALGRQSSFKEHLPETLANCPHKNNTVNRVPPRPPTPLFPPVVNDDNVSCLSLEPSPTINRVFDSQKLLHQSRSAPAQVLYPEQHLRPASNETSGYPSAVVAEQLKDINEFPIGESLPYSPSIYSSNNFSKKVVSLQHSCFASQGQISYSGQAAEKINPKFCEIRPARLPEKATSISTLTRYYSQLQSQERHCTATDRLGSTSRILSVSPPKFDPHRLLETNLKTGQSTKASQPSKMAAPRVSQFLDPSSAMATLTKQKAESIKLAREQAAAVNEMSRRAKTEAPPYEFEELIGKGAYGRVYKGRQLPSREVVAIKVMDIDNLDYKMHRDMKDESIKDFMHEIKAMNQAKQSGARNINRLIEAISIHSQLWVVCEYCPGGSVKTLMRATGDKLEERFIIPIARELASGLRAIHDAGIIHRDVKAGNVLIHEEGRLQICDFGVAGIIQSKVDKRSTWIGTPHWMPPEMFSTRGGEAHQYGSELDVWAYGCTIYEFATGNPPNAGLRERMQIGRSLGRNTPKLDGEGYSEELKSLISFSLDSNPSTRPNMSNILEHPYIADSESEYPTKSMSELVRIYYQWSQSGGQRMSLFHPGGAAAAEVPENVPLDEDWNFSTTDGFERRYSVLDMDQFSASLAELAGNEPSVPQHPEMFIDDDVISEMTPIEKANFDERVKRGAAAMEGLFDEQKPSYRYETKNDFIPIEEPQPQSDLPLRMTTDRSSVMSTFIDMDLGSYDSSHYAAGSASQFQLADADTIRANRSSLRSARDLDGDQMRNRDSENDHFQPSAPRPPTMDWKFPSMVVPEDPEPEASTPPTTATTTATAMDEFVQPAEEKRATRDWKFPLMTDASEATVTDSEPTFNYEPPTHTIRPSHVQSQQSVIDLDPGHPGNNLSVDGIDVASLSRPSTATSTISDYDPFRLDRGLNISQHSHQRMVSKAASVLSGSSLDDGPGPDHEDYVITDDGPGPDHEDVPELTPNAVNSSMTAQMAILEASHEASRLPSQPLQIPDIKPPSTRSLFEDASDDVVEEELNRLIDGFMDMCHTTINAVENLD